VVTDLMTLLRDSVRAQSRTDKVGLLLSAGIDSVSVGLALEAEGKNVQAYTIEVQGYVSSERRRVEQIAMHLGWHLKVITIPTVALRNDFLDLAIRYRCRKKVQFETAWPLLYVLPQVEEDEVWSGWNADDHYGNTKKVILEQSGLRRDGISSADRKRRFGDFRTELRKSFFEPDSQDSWWYAQRVADHHGRRLFDAYITDAIFEHFLQFDHDQLSLPKKPIIRDALSDHLRGLPLELLRGGVRLQKGGQIHILFKTLLADSQIDRFGSRVEDRLSAIASPEEGSWARMSLCPRRRGLTSAIFLTPSWTQEIYVPFWRMDPRTC
jgi:asparagine synthetase B (glutamine-hydrolysing)